MAGYRDEAVAPMPGGLLQSLLTLLGTLAATARTRVELFSNEVELEVHRLFGLLVAVLVAMVFAGLTLLFGALSLVVALWETHRLAAVAACAIGFGVLAIVAGLDVRRRSRRTTRLLAATLGELQVDAERLGRRAP